MDAQQVDVAAEVDRIAREAADGVAGHLDARALGHVQRLKRREIEDLLTLAYRCGAADAPLWETLVSSPQS